MLKIEIKVREREKIFSAVELLFCVHYLRVHVLNLYIRTFHLVVQNIQSIVLIGRY